MQLEEFPIELNKISGAVPAWQGTVNAEQWRSACEGVRTAGGRLIALWGSDERERGRGYAVYVALTVRSGLVCLRLDVEELRPAFPDISREERHDREGSGRGMLGAVELPGAVLFLHQGQKRQALIDAVRKAILPLRMRKRGGGEQHQ